MSLVVAGQVKDVAEVKNPYADVIVPPPAIRDVIDKTAGFVASHGVEFERRMMQEANAEERFAFLFPGHSFRDYYDIKVKEAKQGKVNTVVPTVPEAVKQVWQNEKEQQNLMLKNEAEGEVAQHERIEEEEGDLDVLGFTEYQYSLHRPNLTAQDDDVIKLTARYAATNGQSFLSGLQLRERGNPLFEFLRTGHPSHSYFKGLVDSYTNILSDAHELRSRLKSIQAEKQPDGTVLPRDREKVHRFMLTRIWNNQRKKALLDQIRRKHDEDTAAEKAAMDSLNWDRFVVVETIGFTDADHQLALPAPDWSKKTTISEPEVVKRVVETPVAPPPVPKAEVARPVPAVTAHVDGEEQKIILKPEYVRRSKRAPGQYLKCPITGQLVLAQDMTNHLKVLLLDKQWKKQRDELLARALADSAYAPDSDIETNIANFVLKRPDLFGSVEDEIQEHAVLRDVETPQKRSRMQL